MRRRDERAYRSHSRSRVVVPAKSLFVRQQRWVAEKRAENDRTVAGQGGSANQCRLDAAGGLDRVGRTNEVNHGVNSLPVSSSTTRNRVNTVAFRWNTAALE